MIVAHTATAVIAILCGLLIVLLRKGSSTHRTIGRVYTVSILAMVILSVPIRQVNDGAFSIFHLISIQTAILVAAGLSMLVLRARIRQWYVWHARFMLYSYVTLLVTGIAQAFEYLPFTSDVLNAIMFIQVPAIAGWVLIEFVGMPRWRGMFRRPSLAPSPR